MAITLDGCRRIVDSVKKAGVTCDMGYHRRLNPLAQFLRKSQEQGHSARPPWPSPTTSTTFPEIWPSGMGWERRTLRDRRSMRGRPQHRPLSISSAAKWSRRPALRTPGCRGRSRSRPRTWRWSCCVLPMGFGPSGYAGRTDHAFHLHLATVRHPGTVDNNRVWLDTIPAFCETGHERDFIDCRNPGSRTTFKAASPRPGTSASTPSSTTCAWTAAAQRRDERFSHSGRLFRRRGIGQKREDGTSREPEESERQSSELSLQEEDFHGRRSRRLSSYRLRFGDRELAGWASWS